MKFQTITLIMVFILITIGCSFVKDRVDGLVSVQAPQLIKSEGAVSLVRILEQTLVYKFNGKTVEKTASLKYMDQQNYSMYILPDYDLVEGADKDVLFLKSDNTIFMDIEMLKPSSYFSQFHHSTYQNVKLFNNHILYQTSLNDLELNKEINSYNNKYLITSYLLTLPKINVKLTMYTKEGNDHQDAFLQMANTIVRKNY